MNSFLMAYMTPNHALNSSRHSAYDGVDTTDQNALSEKVKDIFDSRTVFIDKKGDSSIVKTVYFLE